MSNANLGKKLSAEHSANISNAHLGKKLFAEHSTEIVAKQIKVNFYNMQGELKLFHKEHGHFKVPFAEKRLYEFRWKAR